MKLCFEAMAEGMVLLDATGRVRLCNRRAEEILGMTVDHMQTASIQPFQRAISENGVKFGVRRHPVAAALRTGKSSQGTMIGVRRPDGQLRWLLLNAQPVVQAGDATPSGVVATFVDITEQKSTERLAAEQLDRVRGLNSAMQFQMRELEKVNAQLEALAALDSLTGLKNHRAFHERLTEEFERSTRYRTPLSVVLIDVDHFKLYNDAFGHPAGDVVLRHLAQIFLDNARDCDVLARPNSGETTAADAYGCVIARHGGEEFSVILPHTDGAGAQKVAERLRAAIENASWDNRKVTASFGVASVVPGIADPAALIAAADKALYRSKMRGRNRVTCAPGSHQIAFRGESDVDIPSMGAAA